MTRLATAAAVLLGSLASITAAQEEVTTVKKNVPPGTTITRHAISVPNAAP